MCVYINRCVCVIIVIYLHTCTCMCVQMYMHIYIYIALFGNINFNQYIASYSLLPIRYECILDLLEIEAIMCTYSCVCLYISV